MIRSKRELRFYIMADMMMNRNKFKWSFTDRLKHIVVPDYTMRYLKSLRWCGYFENCPPRSPWGKLLKEYHYYQYRKLGEKLLINMGGNSVGYGVLIPHSGPVCAGVLNRIGNFAVFHVGSWLTSNGKVIGDGLYMSVGAKITTRCRLGDNVSVAANSVVNKSFGSDVLLAGMPAEVKKSSQPWYVRDGGIFLENHDKVEALRISMGL